MRTVLSLFLVIFVCHSCMIGIGERGNGNIRTQEFNIEDYSSVYLGGSAKMIYQQLPDEKPYLKIEIDENLIPYLEPDVSNNRLEIKSTRNINPTKYIIYTNSTSLHGMVLAGSGNIKIDGNIITDRFETSVSGSGVITVENVDCRQLESSVSGSGHLTIESLKADLLKASVSGSGKFIASGTVARTNTNVSGSGDIDIYEVVSSGANSKISGSGTVKVNVSDSIKAKITGSGHILYKGNPHHKDISTTGSGRAKAE